MDIQLITKPKRLTISKQAVFYTPLKPVCSIYNVKMFNLNLNPNYRKKSRADKSRGTKVSVVSKGTLTPMQCIRDGMFEYEVDKQKLGKYS